MKKTATAVSTVLVAALLLAAGCSDSDTGQSALQSPTASPSRSAETSPGPSAAASSTSPPDENVEGTVVRFTAGSETLDVTIGQDSPAVRDFLSMLPMNLTPEGVNGREKIADLPRELKWQGSPGSDPEDGDLISRSFSHGWGAPAAVGGHRGRG